MVCFNEGNIDTFSAAAKIFKKTSRFHGRKVPINAINNLNGQADVYVTVMGMSNEAFTGSLRATFAHADVKRKKKKFSLSIICFKSCSAHSDSRQRVKTTPHTLQMNTLLTGGSFMSVGNGWKSASLHHHSKGKLD